MSTAESSAHPFKVGLKDGCVTLEFTMALRALALHPDTARALGRALIAWSAQAEASTRIKDLANRMPFAANAKPDG